MKCFFIKSDKSQCKANAVLNSSYCFSHDPDNSEAKREAVTKGGKSPKRNMRPLKPVELTDQKSVAKLLSTTINEVRQGKIELRVANCIGYLSGHLIKAIEVSILEERVSEIEKYLLERPIK